MSFLIFLTISQLKARSNWLRGFLERRHRLFRTNRRLLRNKGRRLPRKRRRSKLLWRLSKLLRRSINRTMLLREISVKANHGLYIFNLEASKTRPSFLGFYKLKLIAIGSLGMSITDVRTSLYSYIEWAINYWFVERFYVYFLFHLIWNLFHWCELMLETQIIFLRAFAFGWPQLFQAIKSLLNWKFNIF